MEVREDINRIAGGLPPMTELMVERTEGKALLDWAGEYFRALERLP